MEEKLLLQTGLFAWEHEIGKKVVLSSNDRMLLIDGGIMSDLCQDMFALTERRSSKAIHMGSREDIHEMREDMRGGAY